MTATMIIWFGTYLEFADTNGKSLGKFHCQNAQAAVAYVRRAKTADERQDRIQNYYEQLSSPEEVMTPAGNSAGFERTTGENQ